MKGQKSQICKTKFILTPVARKKMNPSDEVHKTKKLRLDDHFPIDSQGWWNPLERLEYVPIKFII